MKKTFLIQTLILLSLTACAVYLCCCSDTSEYEDTFKIKKKNGKSADYIFNKYRHLKLYNGNGCNHLAYAEFEY